MSGDDTKNKDLASRLPFDVLVPIFVACPYKPSTFSPKITPWTLSQVCSSWRSAALYTRRLWSTIHLKLSELTATPIQLEMLSTALERSNGGPLYITIECDRPLHPNATAAFQILVAVAEQWQTLEFKYNLENLLVDGKLSVFEVANWRPNTDHSRYQLSQLRILSQRVLDVEGSHSCPLRVANSLNPILCHSHLVSLEIMDLSLLYSEFSVFPWDQITHFAAHEFTLTEILTVLRRCTKLESLELKGPPTRSMEADVPSSLTLPKVRSFVFPTPYRQRKEPQPETVFPFLNLPSLRHLGIRGINEFSNIDAILQFIGPYQDNIRSAEIDMTCELPMDITIENLLRLLRNTTHLILRGRLFSHLFSCFPSSSSDTLLPNLQTLEVRVNSDCSILAPSLDAIVNAAFSMPRLRRLYVQIYGKDIDENVNSRLKQLQSSGVEATVEFAEYCRTGDYAQLACEELVRILWGAFRPSPGVNFDFRCRHIAENIPILDEVMNLLELHQANGVLQRLDEICMTTERWERVQNTLKVIATRSELDRKVQNDRFQFRKRAKALANSEFMSIDRGMTPDPDISYK